MLVRRLGADPEFEVVKDGRLVRADEAVRTTRLPFGEIGVDGAGVALELRPNPGDVDELVRNTAKLIVAAPRVCQGTPTTIGVWHPLGGHVHFDVPDDTDYGRLVLVIDDALGPLFRALNSPAREGSQYGKRRDWRPQPWGVEYRTPPATIWSHPEVARGFLKAMLTLVLSNGREMTPAYEELVEMAAFTIEGGRKLHFGAWAREAERDPRTFSVVYQTAAEKDDHFEGDMEAALAPLGISLLQVWPLHKRRGDWASNLPGFGSRGDAPTPAYYEAGRLHVALSWRFRNDREFRMMEMPAFLGAVLELIRGANESELDERVVVVELVEKPTASEDAKEEVKRAAEEERSAHAPTPLTATEEEEDDEYVHCYGCGRRIRIDDAIHNRYDHPYCLECYYETHTLCSGCQYEVYMEDVRYPSTGEFEDMPLCRDCYAEIYAACASCGEEIQVDVAIVPTSGRYSGSYMCEYCYGEWYTCCEECGEDTERRRAREVNGRTLCELCADDGEEEVEA